MNIEEQGVWAVVPVKEFGAAKSRLAERYEDSFRRGLAQAMLEDVLGALAVVPELRRVIVVTVDREATRIAKSCGAETFTDGARDGHTGAVMAAARVLASRGCCGMLTVPGDIPCITPGEVSRLLAAHRTAPAFSIVPASDFRGSNAILLTPPNALPLQFGNDSFQPHCEVARRFGIEPTIVPMPGIGLDIDTPSDLHSFMSTPSPTRTWAYLARRRMVQPCACPAAAAEPRL